MRRSRRSWQGIPTAIRLRLYVLIGSVFALNACVKRPLPLPEPDLATPADMTIAPMDLEPNLDELTKFAP